MESNIIQREEVSAASVELSGAGMVRTCGAACRSRPRTGGMAGPGVYPEIGEHEPWHSLREASSLWLSAGLALLDVDGCRMVTDGDTGLHMQNRASNAVSHLLRVINPSTAA